MKLYPDILKDASKGKKKLSVLIDPDKTTGAALKKISKLATDACLDYFFIGSSLLMRDTQDQCLAYLREHTRIPVIIFPGNSLQINSRAHAILLLSLISGRNPEMLIGKHVVAAPLLKASKLEVISTGYLLIENGLTTSVAYMSNTMPIPANKPEIAVCTAMAGEMLGMKLIYLDAGSGAMNPVPSEMINQVKKNISIPLLIGGGISNPKKAKEALDAGADMIVVGNAIEKKPELILRIAQVIQTF
jgi:putative glycerol-1-phosphate prenyltransferase